MRKYALIGYPLGHSLSPQIHTRLMELYGEDGTYEKIEISPEELKAGCPKLAELAGFNITIPHKVGIIPYCDRLDPTAAGFGSVNCVKNGEEKVGYNTDVIGFTRSIEMLGGTLSSKVLLIGCGGVGRMMLTEAVMNGADATVAVIPIDKENTEKLISELKERKPDAKIRLVIISGERLSMSDLGGNADFDLLINATPIGMFPKIDASPCDDDVAASAEYVFDAVYNPRVTRLVKTARDAGKNGMNGMAMLVLQAAAAHEIWNGAKFDDNDLRTIISDMEALIK